MAQVVWIPSRRLHQDWAPSHEAVLGLFSDFPAQCQRLGKLKCSPSQRRCCAGFFSIEYDFYGFMIILDE
jgi:hypothetical protein